MPKEEKDWDLNVVVTDPEDPEGLEGRTYGMISGGKKIQVGDTVPQGVVEGFVDRGVRILPDEGPEYTVRMGEHSREKNKKPSIEDVAETVLEKEKKKNYQTPESLQGFPVPIPGISGIPAFVAKTYQNKLIEQKMREEDQRDRIDTQIAAAKFPDPRTDEAVRNALDDMLDEQFVGLTLLKTSTEHKNGVPDNIYFEAGDGSIWEWNSTGEIIKAED